MAKHSTLRKIITKMSLLELLYTIFILLALIVTFNLSIQLGIIYPANHAERQLPVLQEQFLNGELNKKDIPDYYEYQLTENGNISQTIPQKFTPLIRQAKSSGYSQTDSLIATKIFVNYEQNERELVLSYRLMATFVSEKLEQFLPPPEILYFGIFLLLWISGFFLIIRHYVSFIRFELVKVNETNEEIKEMNLEYSKKSSKIQEIQETLDSLDSMSSQLKQSLKRQWTVQQHQKELVQSVTHDIRTPITLIKGNLELLEETQITIQQNEQLADLKHGVKRLEQYVEQLKIISGMMKENPNKRPIDQNMLIEWSNLAFDLVKNHEMSIEIQKQEESKLDVIKEQLTNALQNVIVNSIDHSLPNSQLILSFEDDSDKYRIIVQDQGTGFSSQALNQATKRYFTTNVNSTNAHYGLGLTIVEEILSSYNGQLKLENVVSEGKVVGAKVTMCLYKTNSFM